MASRCGSYIDTDCVQQMSTLSSSLSQPSMLAVEDTSLSSGKESDNSESDDENDDEEEMVGGMNISTEQGKNTTKESQVKQSNPIHNKHHHNQHNQHNQQQEDGLEDEMQWGYMKEEDIQTHIGNYYGFSLSILDSSGCSCGLCPWQKGCTGCSIIPDDNPLYCLSNTRRIAIDWDPAFLNLYGHQILSNHIITHQSVEEVDMMNRQNILLAECMQKALQTEVLHADKNQIRCEHV